MKFGSSRSSDQSGSSVCTPEVPRRTCIMIKLKSLGHGLQSVQLSKCKVIYLGGTNPMPPTPWTISSSTAFKESRANAVSKQYDEVCEPSPSLVKAETEKESQKENWRIGKTKLRGQGAQYRGIGTYPEMQWNPCPALPRPLYPPLRAWRVE